MAAHGQTMHLQERARPRVGMCARRAARRQVCTGKDARLLDRARKGVRMQCMPFAEARQGTGRGARGQGQAQAVKRAGRTRAGKSVRFMSQLGGADFMQGNVIQCTNALGWCGNVKCG